MTKLNLNPEYKHPTLSRQQTTHLDEVYERWKGDRTGVSGELYKAIRNLASNITWNVIHENNEDLVEDATTKMVLAVDKYQGGSRFSTWIWKGLFNTVLNYQRDRKRRGEVSLDDLNELTVDDLSHQVDKRKTLDEAMDGLPEDQRQVVELRLAGHNFDEVAEELGIPLSTAKNRWLAALSQLRREKDGTAEQGGLKAAGPCGSQGDVGELPVDGV